ncbi:MAG: tyrosine-type recombinase/integrase [Oscillospiraceae bacterium]|jgi:integrase/recombinase XerD|nr:tyrosine-type recombinase/integrase [Oscillospiraceae bacterium]
MIDITTEFTRYLEYCKYQKKLSEKTQKAYLIDLTQFGQYLENKDYLARPTITEFITHLHKVFSSKTVKRKLASVKAFYNYLEYEEIFLKNPFSKIKTKFQEPHVLPRVIPIQFIKKILHTAYDRRKQANTVYASFMALRDVVIIELLFATGIRVSELCSLNIEHINHEDGSIRITGKGEKERLIFVGNRDVLKVLYEYMNSSQSMKNNSNYLFVNRLNLRLSDQSVRSIIKEICIKAGISLHITPHMFRHTFATLLLEEDVDIRYIQHMLGHSSIKTTQIYTQVTTKKQRLILTNKHPRNKLEINT